MKPIKHNSAIWEVRTNRHPNTDGSSWGWIDGAPGNVCWSNNEPFNRSRAGEVVAAHNAWLEKQTPVEARLLVAREKVANLQLAVDQAQSALDAARSERHFAMADVEELEAALTATPTAPTKPKGAP